MMMISLRKRLLVFVLLILLATGCTPERRWRLVRPQVRDAVLSYILENVPCDDGDWEEDFGDATFYSIAFFAGWGYEKGVDRYILLAHQTADYVVRIYGESIRDPVLMERYLPDLIMGAFGLMELIPYDPQPSYRETLQGIVLFLDLALASQDYFIDGRTYPNYFASTYGTTVLNGLFASLFFQYALLFPNTYLASVCEGAGTRILSRVEERMFDEEKGYFLFNPDEEGLYLYPNIVMIISYLRAYQVLHDRSFLEMARKLHQAIQPLHSPRGGYRSPYSASFMGAKTDDYSTLSSQNYTMIAFILLYEATGEEGYLEEVEEILDFIETHLWEDGKLLHHWMDGRAATPGDPEYYCSGCNFQFLYIQWYLERSVLPGLG